MSKRSYNESFGDDQGYNFPTFPGYPPQQNTSYPPQNTSYPQQSTSYPQQSTSYPPQNTSYPANSYDANSYDPAAYGVSYDQYDPNAYAPQYGVDAYGPVFPQYAAADTSASNSANSAPAAPRKELSLKELNAGRQKDKRITRAAGGELWEDKTLLEWDDTDFRIFAGDLGKEVTDETLRNAFSKFPSFLKARVVRDKRTGKSRGYGFISFKDPADYAKVMKEMNGKYIGNRPIKLRKSEWKDRQLDNQDKKEFKALKKIKDSSIGKA